VIAICCDACTDIICEAPTSERAVVKSIKLGAEWRDSKVRCPGCRRENANVYARRRLPIMRVYCGSTYEGHECGLSIGHLGEHQGAPDGPYWP
jgi:ribosomal protein S27E